MSKRTTVRFYTAYGQYKGWQYLNKTTYFQIINWLNSYNYLLVGNQRYEKDSPAHKIFKLLKRKD